MKKSIQRALFSHIPKDSYDRLTMLRAIEVLKQYIEYIVENISSDLKINIKDIYFRRMKSKWGSCSPNKNLTINKFLKYLPENLIEYVIFHEMIHLKERRHNKHFWRIISTKFDNYEEKEKELFEYWFLIQKVVPEGFKMRSTIKN